MEGFEMRYKLPKGNADWPGWSQIYDKLSIVAEKLGSNPQTHLSDEHVYTLDVLGSGHEETMKGWMHYCMERKWL